MMQRLALTCFLVGSIGCGDGNPTRGEAYLNEILSVMRANALTRNDVDWENLRDEVDRIASGAESIRDTYPAITRALVLLNTNHSLLLGPDGTLITYPSEIRCQDEPRQDRYATESVGFIKVNGFTGSESGARAYAGDIQAQIAAQDGPEIEGWIVDLRDNTGGNMWPMIAGLGPLFDSATLGHFIDADDNATPWGYANGSSRSDGIPMVTVASPYSVLNSPRRIAVLSSERVASSGEATLIAFKKQPNVRIFGRDSCGLSTANSGFELSDGSTLLLTTAVTADREQEPYGGRVAVDETKSAGATLQAAVEWLNR